MNWPAPLVSDIARRRAVLFLGAGVSRNSQGVGGKRPPLWAEFLRTALAKCEGSTRHISGLLKRGDYLTACEILKKRLQDEWGTLITREFVDPGYQPSGIHHEIFKLDTRLVLTQNVDKIYDTFAQTESHNTILVKNYYDIDTFKVLRGDVRAVVKVHGTVDSQDRMVFTRNDYVQARGKHPYFYDCLDALILTHTFVFIGCGIADPDMQLFLEKHARSFPGGRPHYLLSPKGMHSDIKESLKEDLSLKVLDYDPSDNHVALITTLEELRKLVEGSREELATTQQW